MKGPAAFIQLILKLLINKTQDINDKILLSFSHSKYVCHCFRDITVLIHCSTAMLGVEPKSCLTSRLSEKMFATCGVTHCVSEMNYSCNFRKL
jgi:hypothetical protein